MLNGPEFCLGGGRRLRRDGDFGRLRPHPEGLAGILHPGREPRLATIVKLAGALKTTPRELCTGISWLPKARRFDVKKPPRG